MKTNLSPYMNLNRIEFMITYQCSGKCKHCSVAPRLNQICGGKHVRADKAIKAIEALSKLFDITSVMTFGGEPLLYSDVVCTIHKTAMERGIAARQVITNGYFTKDNSKCRDIAYALKDAGVNSLLLSVDAFHQETIPLDAPYEFAKNIVEAGIPGVQLQPAWVINEAHDNPYNTKTREVLEFLSNLGIPVNTGNNIFMAGNAREHLSQYYEKPEQNLSSKCGTMPYTDPLTEISSLSIVPNGDVMICSFVIGNIYTEDVAEIVARYNPYSNDCMKAIIEGGVSALLSYAENIGIGIDTLHCYSICDVCHSVAKQFSSIS